MTLVPSTRDEWEELSAEELDGYSDLQIREALKEHFGFKSAVYFMGVDAKKDYLLNPDDRPTIQAAARERQKEHQAAGAEHKGKVGVKVLVTERSEEHLYEFVGVDRPDGGFTDPFNDRAGVIAYVIRDAEDGSEFPTQKQTCRILTELRRLKGFDAKITAKKQRPAHRAGHQTVEDVIAAADPDAELHRADLTTATTAAIDNLVGDSGKDLDAILDSID